MELKPLPRVFRTATGPHLEVWNRTEKGVVASSLPLSTLCMDSNSAELVYDAIDRLMDALAEARRE